MHPIITRNGTTYLVIGNLLRPLPPTAVVESPAKVAAPTAVTTKKARTPVPMRFPTTRKAWHLQCSQAKEGIGLTLKEDWLNPKTFSNQNKNERHRRSMARWKWSYFSTRRAWEEARGKRAFH